MSSLIMQQIFPQHFISNAPAFIFNIVTFDNAVLKKGFEMISVG